MKHWILGMILVVGLSGCHRGYSGQSKTGGGDAVAGSWAGFWKERKHEGSGLPLSCEAVRTGPDQWLATFHAVCNIEYTKAIDLEGHREGDKVVFGGDVDLGQEHGGVFTWRGEAVGDVFHGTYTSDKGYDGLFHMTRAD